MKMTQVVRVSPDAEVSYDRLSNSVILKSPRIILPYKGEEYIILYEPVGGQINKFVEPLIPAGIEKPRGDVWIVRAFPQGNTYLPVNTTIDEVLLLRNDMKRSPGLCSIL